MPSLLASLLLSLASFSQAAPADTGSKLTWGPCKAADYGFLAASKPVFKPIVDVLQCASLLVKLDYSDPKDNRTMPLEIIKIPATKTPSLGSILTNWGGPGEQGRIGLIQNGASLINYTAGAYDLLGIDPRGVNRTLPFNMSAYQYLLGQYDDGLRGARDSELAPGMLWARAKVNGAIAAATGNAKETAPLMGTAFTARDFMSVVDALGGDKLLRYYGYSYGSTLGATLAAMFPDRIEKMVVDGVSNAHEYYNSQIDIEQWAQTDAVVDFFFDSCVKAGPAKCSLAGLNKTAAAMSQDFWRFMDEIRVDPIPAGLAALDSNQLASVSVLGYLKAPFATFPKLDQQLRGLMYPRNSTEREATALQIMTALGGPVASAPDGPQYLLMAIHCTDTIPRAASLAELRPTFDRLYNTSRLAGITQSLYAANCARWPFHAKEVYRGDFRVKTRNPIMLVSNARDAHTPPISAFNMSAGFEGSSVLLVNGTGHTSMSNAPSDCTIKNMHAYWLNGTLPKNATLCDAPGAWI